MLLQPDRPAAALAPLGLAYGLAGRRADGLNILTEMEQVSQKRYISPYYLAVVYSGLGRMDEAFRLLDQALEQRTPWLVFCTRYDPLSVALRRDPRWKPFVDRLRLQVRLPPGTPNPYSKGGRERAKEKLALSSMQKLTTRQLESRLLKGASDHRCEITGVKFRAGLLSH